ncbi:Hypothetical Protein FCC1311_101622 [Hondaea fermentalgiana]|uniref:Uncharacterized protein n=1 Tax=Hondaea fermentalgiana TaxID=2315210 RepID=A0A2R5GUD9_9STRA|nr:Hypothetical Protein FCC1311_101622 [Hondaea fermentalgiana]|eukprot:GBG33939.1 Hypothetical Protein FCC1311_101622 [Hondaea fermentalgiana]
MGSSAVPGAKLGASLVRKWTEYQEEDAMVLGIGVTVACVCMASGQCDEMLLFGAISLLFGILVTCKLPALHVETTLRDAGAPEHRTDIMAALEREAGIDLSTDTEAILFSVGWVLTALAILLLARRTLQRYSPAACVILYCACLSTVLRDRAADAQPVMATIVASMCALSLKSNHVLRLHIAAACFCACMLVMSEWSQSSSSSSSSGSDAHGGGGGLEVQEVLGPSGVSLCLTVGLGACLAHDLTAFFLLEPAVDAAHLCYVLLATLFNVDAALELASGHLLPVIERWIPQNLVSAHRGPAATKVLQMRWADSLERMGRLRVSAPWAEILTYPNLVALAPPFCVFFASTMILRRLFSPKATWRRSRFKWTVAILACGLAGTLAWAYTSAWDWRVLSRHATSPAALTMASSGLYLLVTLVTASTKHCSIVKGKWWTMIYFQSGQLAAGNGSGGRGGNGSGGRGGAAARGGPPPFYIRGADDARVKAVATELTKLLGTYKSLALQVQRLQRATEGNVAPGREPDLEDVEQLAKQQIQAADVACRAAVAAEKVALQLRELTSDAETERDLLLSIRKHSKTVAAAGRSTNDHYMVIKRQTDNAVSSFALMRKEMEDAETQAESLMEQARRELRRAVKYYARSRLAARDKHARHDLDQLMAKLTTRVDRQIMDPDQVKHYLSAAKASAQSDTGRGVAGASGSASTPAAGPSHSLQPFAGHPAGESKDALASPSGAAAAPSTPYEMAMKRKGISAHDSAGSAANGRNGLSGLDAGADGDFQGAQGSSSAKFAHFIDLSRDEGNNGASGRQESGKSRSTASGKQSSSQRSKRRWWPFSSSSARSRAALASSTPAGAAGASSSAAGSGVTSNTSSSDYTSVAEAQRASQRGARHRSLNLSNKRK